MLLSGTLLAPGDTKLIDLIEALGGRIVADDLCSGLRPFLGLEVKEPSVAGVAAAYLDRVPYAFSTSPYSIFRLPEEVELLSNLRYNYLLLSLQDRLRAAHAKGVPVVLVQGGQSMEPYYAAGAILAFPYELPTEERARWTADQARRARADGLIFMYHWGCNYQSAVSRMICDIVREEAGLPTITLEVGELGRAEGLEQPQNRIEAFIEMLE